MTHSNHYQLISSVLQWLVENQKSQPALDHIAHEFGLSEFHLQRTFQEYVGVSPKQFLKFLGKQEAIRRLKDGQTVFDTALDIGLSGPGRLHDLIITTESVTPGQIRQSGHGVEMQYGFGSTPFGTALVAWTSRGISFLGFCDEDSRNRTLADLKQQWPGVTLSENGPAAGKTADKIFATPDGVPTRIWLRGSPFQLKVWEALLKIPLSENCSYGQVAIHIGQPKASRAVGSAVGSNPVAWLIPCHRVITSLGTLGGYRWGTQTKEVMLAFEKSRSHRYAQQN
jgi:AraC family transcriptional regulator of adaptative response/methylated-DNA-[protein]-cysteine methyltransferase